MICISYNLSDELFRPSPALSHTSICICMCVYMCVYACMYVCMYIYVYVYIACVCIYVCVYIYMCVCICMYVYINIYFFSYALRNLLHSVSICVVSKSWNKLKIIKIFPRYSHERVWLECNELYLFKNCIRE